MLRPDGENQSCEYFEPIPAQRSIPTCLSDGHYLCRECANFDGEKARQDFIANSLRGWIHMKGSE